jgi:polysaccharide export outer membrane protein
MGLSLGLATGQQKTQESHHNQNSDAMSGIEPTISSASEFQQRNPRYRLEPGDSFEVFFELSPEFNQTATIQPDGYAALRGIDDLWVANRTMPELTELLRSAYAQILHEPRIKVVLKDFEKPYFIADGQVGHPGKYELRGDTTLTQGIAMSGGFLDSAKHSQVLLFRRASEGWFSARIVDVKKMQKQGNLNEDPQLHPGDMLFVPKNRFSKIKPFLPGYSVGMMVQPY